MALSVCGKSEGSGIWRLGVALSLAGGLAASCGSGDDQAADNQPVQPSSEQLAAAAEEIDQGAILEEAEGGLTPITGSRADQLAETASIISGDRLDSEEISEEDIDANAEGPGDKLAETASIISGGGPDVDPEDFAFAHV